MTHHESSRQTHESRQDHFGPSSLGSAVIERTIDAANWGERDFRHVAAEWRREHGVTFAPAYDHPHVRQAAEARRDSIIGWEEEGVVAASEYLRTLFPGKQFELISDEGSSAVVFGDENFAYKVMRTPDSYSYFEGEVATMQRLHRLGLAPEPVALIDAAREQQRENPAVAPDYKFATENIPRIQSNGMLPVIVMERVEAPMPPAEAPAAARKRLPDAVRAMLRNNVALGDCELSYDDATGKFTVLDCGGSRDLQGRNPLETQRIVETMLSLLCKFDLRIDAKTGPYMTVSEWLRMLDDYAAKL